MMQPRVSARLLVLFGVSVSFGAGPMLAHADDPCAAFTWDVRHERALFGQPARPLAAGRTPAASPPLATDQLYQLKLSPQTQVTFVAPPGGKRRVEVPFAGLARVTVHAPGVYRIALDQPVWVDVIAGGTVVAAKDHQGRPGCNAPHKIVEFALPAGTPVTLQFSGGDVATVKVTVSRSPAPQTG
jgi:hypothetical protein